jgi:hypothetical protein
MNAELGELLGSGREAEVLRRGDHVLELNRRGASKASAFREAANLAIVERLGLPAPVPLGVTQVDQRWVLMTLAPGESFGAVILRQTELMPDYLAAIAELHARILKQPGTGLMSLKERLSAISIRPRARQCGAQATARRAAPMPRGWQVVSRRLPPLEHPWITPTSDRRRLARCLLGKPGDRHLPHVRADEAPRPQLADAYLAVCEAIGLATRADVLAWLPLVAAAGLADGVDALMEMVRGR